MNFCKNPQRTYYVPYPFFQHKSDNAIDIKLYQKNISHVNKVRYLGFYLSNNNEYCPFDYPTMINKITLKINISMCKFLNKFGHLSLKNSDLSNRCFYMFTYSQADWNLQVIPIYGHNQYFTKLSSILRKSQRKYIGLQHLRYTNIEHDYITGFVDLKLRALYLFTSFILKNWQANRSYLYLLLHKFIQNNSIFPRFNKNFQLIKKVFNKLLDEDNDNKLIKDWKEKCKQHYIHIWKEDLKKKIKKSHANWVFNIKLINYEPQYRRIFQIPNKTSSYKVKIFFEVFFDSHNWASKNTCPKCHKSVHYFKFHLIMECNYFLFRRFNFFKKLLCSLVPHKNKVICPSQLILHNWIIKSLYKMKIGQIDPEILWRMFLIPDSINNDTLCKNNLSRFSSFQNILFNSILDWIILIKNFLEDKDILPFSSDINVPSIILSQDINRSTKESLKRCKLQIPEALNRYNQIQYNQQLVYIWTDGSYNNKIHLNKSACGIVVKFPQFYFTIQILISGTINFAELVAISAAIFFNQIIENNKPLLIFTDSQFCFDSIFSSIKKDSVFSSFIIQIQQLVHLNQVNIVKIPSHCGIIGNELADNLAKQILKRNDVSIEINSYNELCESLTPPFTRFLYQNHFISKTLFRFSNSTSFCKLNIIESSILSRKGIG